MADEIKRIDIAEFRREGYLQEVNRRFFHPLGLALEVTVDDAGSERLGGIWDYRDDPEGVYFAGDYASEIEERATRIDALWAERAHARKACLGYVVQPTHKPTLPSAKQRGSAGAASDRSPPSL